MFYKSTSFCFQRAKKVWCPIAWGYWILLLGWLNSVLNLSEVFSGYSNYGSNYCKANCLKLIPDKIMSMKSCFQFSLQMIRQREIITIDKLTNDVIILII